ncbi:MAG: hypothetical protein FWD53_03985 [Phycisphaerales bacterium]|nr:hypothetical protein [Phycisphaerales bacterium]
MIRSISIQDLPLPTRELLTTISPDEELVIEQGGQPVVRITPVPPTHKPQTRPLGLFQGQVWMAPDFNDELPEEFWCPPDDPLTK